MNLNSISLAGHWNVTWSGGQHGYDDQHLRPLEDPQRYLEMEFPGSIHTGLQKAGIIEDPRVGINALKARWVEEQFWFLRRAFDLPAEGIGEPVYLHIGVVDGVAEIAINGKVVGKQANSHYPAVIPLDDCLVAGRNELTIRLESGLFTVADLPGKDYSINLETLLVKRHHLRQAQYQFGWDWNPRLVYLGLHGPLQILWGSDPWLKQVVVLGEVAEDLQSARIRVGPVLQVSGRQPAEDLDFILTGPGGLYAESSATLLPGVSSAEIILEVPNPRLWWPRGHGEAFLYPLELVVSQSGREIARWSGRTGLRRVEIDQPPHPEKGRYFHLKINGKPIFCKGANWIPPEMSGHEVAVDKVAALVDLAVAENMNTLRLWGGGVWANHTLLDRCDERGILLWHDLLFACSKYPADRPEFLADVEREVAWGIREFSPHPSLVVWCGNNEIEAGDWEWGYKQFGRTVPDYHLFHQAIPTLLTRLDPTRPYWPSSPYSDAVTTPSDPTVGDTHPWSVSLGPDDIDFWAYRRYVDRFPNEGGVLGCAPVASLGRFLSPAERKPRSFAWEHHDNTIAFWRSEPGFPYRQVEYFLGCVVKNMPLENYTIASGLMQAEGLKEYILNFRRRWPSTSSAIYWMFNDSWPTVHGWGTIDYYLNRKLAFHPVRRAFADLLIILADEGDAIGVYVVNDTPAAADVQLQTGSFDPAGDRLDAPVQQCPVPAYTSLKAQTLPRDPQRIAYAVLSDASGRALAQDRLLLRPFRDWEIPTPEIIFQAVERDGKPFARYQCDTWVWGVVLDPTGEARVTDDVFDLLPGIPYEVALAPDESPRPVAFTGNALL